MLGIYGSFSECYMTADKVRMSWREYDEASVRRSIFAAPAGGCAVRPRDFSPE